jgi:heme/copper-type cytochrome/quinol oxidase subunit 3
MASLGLLGLAISFTVYLHYITLTSLDACSTALGLLSFSIFRWQLDIITEATFEGHHTLKVQKNIHWGMFFFIVSETMFFFSFFWAFFYTSGSPPTEISCWPPLGIVEFNPFSTPLVSTVILLSSGISFSWSHRAVVVGYQHISIIGLWITAIYGLGFTAFQVCEYIYANFSINDSIYGSLFYLCTGFHGFHVIMGTILLFIALLRNLAHHFMSNHHTGFEISGWYWHFVDLVWIFLYMSIYFFKKLQKELPEQETKLEDTTTDELHKAFEEWLLKDTDEILWF